jgi:phosphoglycerate kinase
MSNGNGSNSQFLELARAPHKWILGRRVLIRTNYDVPLDEHEEVADDTRIRASLDSIRYCLDKGAERVFLMSHMGRPQELGALLLGTRHQLSLKIVKPILEELLREEIDFKQYVLGKNLRWQCDCRVVLLENLRYYVGEERNDRRFAKQLVEATGADLVALDAFPVMHRKHASVNVITQLGVPVVGGFSLVEEVKGLSQVFDVARGKKVAIVSGAKVKDKAAAIEGLAERGFTVLVGGLIAANGYRSDNPNVVVAHDFARDSDGEILGIGNETLNSFIHQIADAGVVVWAGPVSWIDAIDRPPYELPSLRIAWAITKATERGAFSCVLGGDTGGFWQRLIVRGEELKCSYRSKGGGAALEYLATGTLAGLRALESVAAFGQ